MQYEGLIIQEDTRQQAGKHKIKHEWFEAHGVEVIRCGGMPCGDYSLPADHSICIDTKKDLQELAGNLCQQHKRFAQEADRAVKFGIKLIVLVEQEEIKSLDDVPKWYNWRLKQNPKAITGKQLYKIMKTFEEHHGCKFEFCNKGETAKRIVEILTQKEGEQNWSKDG